MAMGNRRLAGVLMIFLTGSMLVSCRTAAPPAVTPGVWYTNQEENLAVQFSLTDQKISGTYVVCDHALKSPQPLKVSWNGHKLKLRTSETSALQFKGIFSPASDHFTLEGKGQTARFESQELRKYPPLPMRYREEIFSRVNEQERLYGRAPGYYTSKPVEDAAASDYPSIVLDVAKSVTVNMVPEDLPLYMDIYTPSPDTARNRPLLLLIHGGAFVAGDKKDTFPVALAQHFAKCGFVVASVNYRMGYAFLPGVYTNLERCMYKGVQDIRAALRYLAEHKKDFGIDPMNIFVGGNSAGGFLTLFTAYMKENEKWESVRGSALKLQGDLGSLDGSGNNAKAGYAIKGIINMWGAVHDLTVIDKEEKIPALLIHGSQDKIVPCDYNYPFRNIDPQLTSFFTEKVYGSDLIKKQMESLGIPVTYLRIEGADHEPQSNDDNSFSPYFPVIRDSISAFINRQLTPQNLTINGPVLVSDTSSPAIYTIKTPSTVDYQWFCTGGFIAKETPTAVRVVWIAGPEKKEIRALGRGRQGQVFECRITVDGQ